MILLLPLRGGNMAKKIRLTPMLKKTVRSIFAKPATTRYPFVKPELPPSFRGHPQVDTSLCVGCGLCSRNCPSKAIEMVEVEGKKYPQFWLDRCIFCGRCIESCHKGAIKNSGEFELATTDKSELVLKPKLVIYC
jgi:hydrogenase-4 component H